MAIKKSQLYSTLWKSCNELRSKSSMNAVGYKDYVLYILFAKYLSDKANQPGFRIKVPEGCFFKDFVALKQNPNIGEEIDKKFEKIFEENHRLLGGLKIPTFNDSAKFGKDKKDLIDGLSGLIAAFENDALDFSKNRAADDDLLGDAYEYLMRQFAAESGKGGQFYTPAEVSRIMAQVLHVEELTRAEQSIYDPTCGSGSLLLRALAHASNPRVSIRGQELVEETASLAKLNMVLHGVSSGEIQMGNTLTSPAFTSNGSLQTFDICVANPPFSQKEWYNSSILNDPYHRWGMLGNNTYLMPPDKCADYAFLLHLIRSMKPETGRGACILPHGVLFRGNAEEKIRQYIVDNHFIKGIIGLPANIFFGTGIPASIIVIDLKNRVERGGIFFIDAKDGFMKDGAKNRLREQDIRRITDAWESQANIPHFSRFVTWDEIKNNNYNLNIPRYIVPEDTEIKHDIQCHLTGGGFPAHDIDHLAPFWTACPSLKSKLFKKNGDYYSLCVPTDNISESITNDPAWQQLETDFTQSLIGWKDKVRLQMLDLQCGCNPKANIAQWSNLLLQTAKEHCQLLSPYDLYDALINYWAETMQDDNYMIANDGWKIPTIVNPGSKKTYNDIVCDLVPVQFILNEYFADEMAKIDQLSQQIAEKQSEIDQLVEENPDTFDFSEGDDEEGDNATVKVSEATVKKAVKEATGDDLKTLKKWLDLCKNRKDMEKVRKEKASDLSAAVVKKYNALTEEEIRTLVVERKWLPTIENRCNEVFARVSHAIVAELMNIVKRYEMPLSQITAEVSDLEAKVNQHLKEMGF